MIKANITAGVHGHLLLGYQGGILQGLQEVYFCVTRGVHSWGTRGFTAWVPGDLLQAYQQVYCRGTRGFASAFGTRRVVSCRESLQCTGFFSEDTISRKRIARKTSKQQVAFELHFREASRSTAKLEQGATRTSSHMYMDTTTCMALSWS